MAGIKICRAGSVVKNITSKATEAAGVVVKTVAAAKNELAKTKRKKCGKELRINRRAALPSRVFKTRGPKPTENNNIPPNRNAVSRSDICSIDSPFSSIVGEVRF